MSGQKDILEDLKFHDLDVSFFYTRQSVPAGLGHAVSCARDFICGEPFVIALGDSIIHSNEDRFLLRRMMDQYEKDPESFVIGTRHVSLQDVYKYGIIKPRKGSAGEIVEIEDLVEKPSASQAPSTLAIAARYIMPYSLFDALERTSPGKGGEIQLTDGIRLLLKEGAKGYSVSLTEQEKRYDIGNIGSYYEAFVDFALEDEKYGYQLKQYIIDRLKL
jgi:UTP--glucose-1-phosphate uridylyltransferase